MFYNLFRRIRKSKPQPKQQVETNEVIIPVGGIDETTGAIYEKKVYPMGKELLYKEVPIDATDEEKEVNPANQRNSIHTDQEGNKPDKS